MAGNFSQVCGNASTPGYLSIMTAVISALLCLVITTGNLLVIILYVIDPLKSLRSIFNYFVVNLAVADLIHGLLITPVTAYGHVLEYLKVELDGKKNTKIFQMTMFVSLIASIICLVTLSIDRYFAVNYAVTYNTAVTKKKQAIGSLFTWILSFSLAAIFWNNDYLDYLTVYINISIAVASVVLVVTSIKTQKYLTQQSHKFIRKHRTSMNSQDSKCTKKRALQLKNVTRIFLWILFMFLVCYIPAAVCVYISQFCKTCSCEITHLMKDFSYYFISGNSCMNPFVCFLKHRNYSNTLRYLFRIKSNRAKSNGNSTKSQLRIKVSTIVWFKMTYFSIFLDMLTRCLPLIFYLVLISQVLFDMQHILISVTKLWFKNLGKTLRKIKKININYLLVGNKAGGGIIEKLIIIPDSRSCDLNAFYKIKISLWREWQNEKPTAVLKLGDLLVECLVYTMTKSFRTRTLTFWLERLKTFSGHILCICQILEMIKSFLRS